MTRSKSPWLPFGVGDGDLRLFVFPNAGGAASMYRRWRGALGPRVDVCPVLLPGRESRMRETPFRRMEDLVPALVDGLGEAMDRPFALAGHSMGTAVAFELARRLAGTGRPTPRLLVLAGRRAPHLPSSKDPIHGAGDDAFRDHLRELGGTPPEVLEHPELMALLMPMLRADFELIETHSVDPEASKLDIPFAVYGGTDDEEASPEELEAWQALTRGEVRSTILPGGHFFLHDDHDRFMRVLRRDLDPFLP